MTLQMIAVSLLLLPPQEEERDRKGAYTARFTEHHPLASLSEVCKRVGWKPADVKKADPGVEAWKLEEESFEVAVPAAYDRAAGAGLLVWISPMDFGDVPDAWLPILAKRNLIVIGANKSGNDRGAYYRTAMALDAVHNVAKRYAIDSTRVYVTGFSGGGRASARCGFLYPDVFRGGLYQGGIEFYKNVPDPADAKRVFPSGFNKPEGNLFKKVRLESRHAVLAGSDDFNQPSSKATFDTMKQERFSHIRYFEMPGEAHVPATADWFDKAIDFLEDRK